MTELRFTNWMKSRRSGSGGDNCVEVAFAEDGTVGVRDSKNRDGPLLEFASAEWTAFIDAVRDGDFEPRCRS